MLAFISPHRWVSLILVTITAPISRHLRGAYRSRLVLGRFMVASLTCRGSTVSSCSAALAIADAPGGSASIGATYNYVTKKYQFLDAEAWPSGAATSISRRLRGTRSIRESYSRLRLICGRTTQVPLRGSRVVRIVAGDGCSTPTAAQHTSAVGSKEKEGCPLWWWESSVLQLRRWTRRSFHLHHYGGRTRYHARPWYALRPCG